MLTERAASHSPAPPMRAGRPGSFTGPSSPTRAVSCSNSIITMGRASRDDALVLIAGAGPVGLLCALLLGRRGLRVRLFEACVSLRDDPRAATTHPATLEVLGEAGAGEKPCPAGPEAPTRSIWGAAT